jgi:exosome complex component RRP43
LRDVRLPKAYWDPDREMVLCEDTLSESKKLQLNGLPIAVTMLVFKAKEQEQGRDKKHWILVDPDTFEEGLCDEFITIVVDGGSRKTKILGLSKAGGTIVGRDEMKELVGLAEERWSYLSQLLSR